MALWSGVPHSDHVSAGAGKMLSFCLASDVKEYEMIDPRLFWLRVKLVTGLFLEEPMLRCTCQRPRSSRSLELYKRGYGWMKMIWDMYHTRECQKNILSL